MAFYLPKLPAPVRSAFTATAPSLWSAVAFGGTAPMKSQTILNNQKSQDAVGAGRDRARLDCGWREGQDLGRKSLERSVSRIASETGLRKHDVDWVPKMFMRLGGKNPLAKSALKNIANEIKHKDPQATTAIESQAGSSALSYPN